MPYGSRYARTFREKARLFTAQNLKLDKLKHLLTRRQHLVRVRAMYKKHISDLNRYMDRDIQKVFDQLDKRLMAASDRTILRGEQLILAQIRGDQQSSTQYDLLRTIPGVGPQLAAYLIALTDGFHRFTDPFELSCHAGVAPFERSSGSSVRGRTQVSHKANKTLKTLLHMAALANVQREGELRTYFQRKVAEGKKPILVVNAIRNKVVHRICAVIRKEEAIKPFLENLKPRLEMT